MDADAFESDAPVQIERMLMKPSDMDSAVVTRTTTKFRPQGGATYGENARTIQFRMSSSDYADLGSLKWGFKCTKAYANMIPEDLYALTCIGDIRVECGGVTVEDIRGAGRILKSLIYSGVDACYLRGDLTFAGSYKYCPTHCGLIAMNTDLGGSSVNEPDTNAPRVASSDISNNQLVFEGTLPAVSAAYTAAEINKIIAQRVNSPYAIYAAHPSKNSAEAGLDVGTAGIKVPTTGSSVSTNITAYNNYTACGVIGKATMPNSMPMYDAVGDLGGAGQPNSKKLATTELTKDYSLPLKLVLGLCRGTSYFPLRNCGSLLIEITLAPYAQQWIHVIPMSQDYTQNYTSIDFDDSHRANSTAALASNTSYTITNPYLQCDIVRVSDAVVSRVDEMCSSQSGYSIPYETYSTITTPFAYSNQVSFNYTRAFSKLKDIYVMFVDQASSQCTQLSKSDYYLGSRFESSNLQVGSTNFPVSDIDTISEAYSELQKTFSHLGTTKGSVINRDTYLGKRAEFAENQFSQAGFFPHIDLAIKNNESSLRMASGLHTQAPSCFLLGNSLERVLSQSGATYGSGLSTRASGFSVTHNLKFKPWLDQNWTDYPEALTNPRFLDAHLGQGEKLLAYTLFHVDGLLRIANDAVEVSM